MNSRVGIVETLRGAAIIVVVIYHALLKTYVILPGGTIPPDTAFFVSGFCLMLPYAQWKLGRKRFQSWLTYVSRRFWKIVPSYYLALAVIAFVFPFEARPGVTRLDDVILHASFLHGLNNASYFSLNGNFWSLSVEFQFYFLFPLIVLSFVRKPWLTTIATVIVGTLFSRFVMHARLEGVETWLFSMMNYLPCFMLGAATSYLYEKHIRDASLTAVHRTFLTVLSIAALGAIVTYGWLETHSGLGPSAWVWGLQHRLLLETALIAFTLCTPAAVPLWRGLLVNRAFSFVSDISYNAFLWNGPVIALLWILWRSAPPWAFVLASCLGTALAACVMTFAFERPIMNVGYRLAKRRPAETLGAAAS